MADLIMPDTGKAVHIPDMTALAGTGIYFLLHEGEVVYVGQATDMRRRVSNHIAEASKQFDAVVRVRCTVNQLDAWERAYIERFVPKYNRCRVAESIRNAGGAEPPRKIEAGGEMTVRIGRNRVRRTVTALA